MTEEEVGELLSVAAGYDRRTVGRTDIEAWQLALDDPRIPNMCLGECVDAVILHYRDTTDFIMPAHILTRVKAERASAIAKALPAGRPSTAAYEQIGPRWHKALTEAQQRMKANKAAVLAHPELAQRLTEPPLNYAKPEQWNGGIPPKYSPEDASRRVVANESSIRAALIELLEAAGRGAAITRKEDHA